MTSLYKILLFVIGIGVTIAVIEGAVTSPREGTCSAAPSIILNESQFSGDKTGMANCAEAVPVDILDYIWYRESRCGKDLDWKIPGPAGELGQYRITPIFIEDCIRISGYVIDPFDNESCRKGIWIVLSEYAPKLGIETIEQYYSLFRCGYGYYKEHLTTK